MKATHFHDDVTAIVRNRAIGYSLSSEGGFGIDMSIFNVVGAGGVHTTVEDLFLWDHNFYHNQLGGYGQSLIEEVTTPGKLNSGELVDYGFGLMLTPYRGLRMFGHTGHWRGYGAEMFRFPEQKFTVICLYNSISIAPAATQIANIYLAESFIEKEKSSQDRQQFVDLPIAEIENRVGFYRSIKSAVIWELTMQEDKLIAEELDMSFQIAPLNQNHYQSVDISVSISIKFEEQNSDSSCRMCVQIENGKPDILERLNTVSLSVDQLADYAGDYYSKELDVNYKFLVEKDNLLLTHKNLAGELLKIVSHDMFKGIYTSFNFIRNGQNQVIGFDLGAGSMKNIYFVKQ